MSGSMQLMDLVGRVPAMTEAGYGDVGRAS